MNFTVHVNGSIEAALKIVRKKSFDLRDDLRKRLDPKLSVRRKYKAAIAARIKKAKEKRSRVSRIQR